MKGVSGMRKLKREPQARRHQVAQQRLLDMILHGELSPGDQLLPEREMAKALGVSRPSVRQALSSLASMGLMEITPRGSYVTTPDLSVVLLPVLVAMVRSSDTYREFFEFRVLLEVEAARLAAERRTAQDLQRLEACVRGMEEAVTAGQSMLECDFQFHLALGAASHNKLVNQMLRVLLNVVRHEAYAPLVEAVYAPAGELEAWVERSQEIVAAIRNQDADQAAGRMRTYLQRVGEITLAHFAETIERYPPLDA